MRRSIFASLVVSLASLMPAAHPAMAQPSFSTATLKTSAGVRLGGKLSAGSLALTRTGVSFESQDYVFDVPLEDIAAVEYHGARMDFLTLVLDPHSKIIAGYRPLIANRTNSVNEQESLLTFQLDPKESLVADVKVAAAFQALVKDNRATRERAVVGSAGVDPSAAAAHPSLGKTVHAFIKETGGLLTFFPDHIQFDSPDARIVLPLSEVARIEPAGARETFLKVTLTVSTTAKGLTQAYNKYQVCCNVPTAFQFVLSPDEPVASSFRLAQDFQQYAGTLVSKREQAIVTGPASGAGTGPQEAKDANRRELGRYDAGFLERHNPSSKFLNSLKVIVGVPGTVVLFNNGVGYVSAKPDPNLKEQRRAFIKDGYLKFLVPSTAIAGVSDVSVINSSNGGSKANSYIAEIDIDRTSPFFEQNKALLTESDQDNRIFLAFHDQTSLTLFLHDAPHAKASRDAF